MTIDRIRLKFEQMKAEERTGLILYLTVGFPDLAATKELVPALVEAGADAIELGVPFSDPLADGTTIQASSFHALQQGVSLRDCINLVGGLRDRVPQTPLILMGYYNPIFSYGLDDFSKAARKAGVDGLIVVDLPTEESEALRGHCQRRSIHLIPLLAPTSTDDRIKRACHTASGFIYCVAVTGVTGVRETLPSGMFQLLRRVRRHTSLPLVVGFGISRREHLENIGSEAEAVIVGSGLINVIQDSPRNQVETRASRFVASLRNSSHLSEERSTGVRM